MEQLQRALHQDSAEQKGMVRVAAEHSHGAMPGEAEDESLTYGKWSMGYDQKSSRGRTAPSLCVQDAVHGALRLNICLADFFLVVYLVYSCQDINMYPVPVLPLHLQSM